MKDPFCRSLYFCPSNCLFAIVAEGSYPVNIERLFRSESGHASVLPSRDSTEP